MSAVHQLTPETPESRAAEAKLHGLQSAAENRYAKGDLRGAAAALEEAEAILQVRYYGMRFPDPIYSAFLGKVYDRLGEYDKARRAMRNALTEHSGESCTGWLYPRWTTLYGDLCRRAGDLAEADRQYRLAVKSFYYEKGDFHALADTLQGDELRQAAYASAAIGDCGRDFDCEEEPTWMAKALELSPNSPFSYLIRSDAYRMKWGGSGDYAKWLGMAKYHANGEIRAAMHAMRIKAGNASTTAASFRFRAKNRCRRSHTPRKTFCGRCASTTRKLRSGARPATAALRRIRFSLALRSGIPASILRRDDASARAVVEYSTAATCDRGTGRMAGAMSSAPRNGRTTSRDSAAFKTQSRSTEGLVGITATSERRRTPRAS